ncbi:MAG: HD-GYP domain-containing protein [Treponema sp.]|uniref:HD-GYP domain-containing protein n=1 Tax=Treponema sp. TaxID=166 RepID=UPI00298EC2A9|nr:HD-GYP domain-containing protein [Treponema sp.]MBR5933645.1 HD-GYP domain-containing protein [Treponema sp.]
MVRKRFFYKLPLIQMSLTLFITFATGLTFYLIYCNRKSNTTVTFIQEPDKPIDPKSDIYIVFSVENSKRWELQNHTFGAQYDGKFINNTNHRFTDWTVTAEVPENYWVDSTWNADFSFYFTGDKPIPIEHVETADYMRQFQSDKNQLVMKKVPNSRGTEVLGKNSKSSDSFMIGMIMYTPRIYEITNIKITGKFIYEPSESIIYHILLIGITISVVAFLILIIIRIAVIKQVKYYEVRQKLDSDIIVQAFKTFANFVDAKDPYTRGHSLRVAHYSREIAKRLKLSDHEQSEIFWLALMHDVGKISVSDSILNKPSKLSEDEYKEIRSHVTKGYEMLKDFTAMPMLKEVAKSHHEHFDGKGYPEGLKGIAIPLEARIVCVSDSFDAMNSDRCYRKKLSKDAIIRELQIEEGKHFDPRIARIMLSMIDDKFINEIENLDISDETNYKP